jgi:hypothetical protein
LAAKIIRRANAAINPPNGMVFPSERSQFYPGHRRTLDDAPAQVCPSSKMGGEMPILNEKVSQLRH